MQASFPQEMYNAPLSGNLVGWLASWRRALEASNRSSHTIAGYCNAMQLLGHYCSWRGHPSDVLHITRANIEDFMIFTANTGHSAYSVKDYFSAIERFYMWLIDEGEIEESPTKKIKKPKLPDTDRPVMTPEHVAALMKSCEGNDFLQRRDMAIVYLLIDTGLRLEEITRIKLEHLDMREAVIHIPPASAKGGKVRDVPIGKKTTAALDRYLRKRAGHVKAELPALWITRQGAMSRHTIYGMIVKRCSDAGLPHTFPHLFRHTFAHMWLSDDGNEGDLKAIGGWRSDVMRRYGKKLAGDRARNAHKLHSPGDKF